VCVIAGVVTPVSIILGEGCATNIMTEALGQRLLIAAVVRLLRISCRVCISYRVYSLLVRIIHIYGLIEESLFSIDA
jgi:hypothetical protein